MQAGFGRKILVEAEEEELALQEQLHQAQVATALLLSSGCSNGNL